MSCSRIKTRVMKQHHFLVASFSASISYEPHLGTFPSTLWHLSAVLVEDNILEWSHKGLFPLASPWFQIHRFRFHWHYWLWSLKTVTLGSTQYFLLRSPLPIVLLALNQAPYPVIIVASYYHNSIQLGLILTRQLKISQDFSWSDCWIWKCFSLVHSS